MCESLFIQKSSEDLLCFFLHILSYLLFILKLNQHIADFYSIIYIHLWNWQSNDSWMNAILFFLSFSNKTIKNFQIKTKQFWNFCLLNQNRYSSFLLLSLSLILNFFLNYNTVRFKKNLVYSHQKWLCWHKRREVSGAY